MMASSVAVQGSGSGSVLWLPSDGPDTPSVVVGLANVLVTRFPGDTGSR